MSRAVLVCLVLAGCAGDSSGVDPASVTCPPGSTLTYENFGQAVISDRCLSCHATKERPALTSQAAVQNERRSIIDSAVTSTSMPEDSSMSLEERQLLGEWLACGAP